MKKALILCVLALLVARASEAFSQSSAVPEIWFQHDDFVDSDNDNATPNEFVPDMLTRWHNHAEWSRVLDNMEVYSIHENLFKTGGAPKGMGESFLNLLRAEFGDMDTKRLHVAYLGLILPVLHAHGVELQIHTVGSKGDFVPWEMHTQTKSGADTTFSADSSGLKLVMNTLSLINGVCDSLFTDGYRVTQVKLQSVLSGIWQRGLQNNVYVALEYMKGVQQEYPEMEFYLGDAFLQRRDHEKNLGWQAAYDSLYYTMQNDPRGYQHLNFKGFRIEFDKQWGGVDTGEDTCSTDTAAFEHAPGWTELAGSDGALAYIHSLGWKAGLEYNNPCAADEWEYEQLVLRTAEKSQELGLNWDFVVLHTDEGGGRGQAYPYDVAPEDRGPDEPPTFASVLNEIFNFYHNSTSVSSPPDLPTHFILSQNYPNPFNPETAINYQLSTTRDVELVVYDPLGQKVRTLADARQPAGNYSVKWNGRNDAGAQVASGVYFYRLKIAGAAVATRKMLFLK